MFSSVLKSYFVENNTFVVLAYTILACAQVFLYMVSNFLMIVAW